MVCTISADIVLHGYSSTLRPADYRAMNTLAYFSNALQSLQVDSLLHCKPYKVPWSKVAVHVNHIMVIDI